jgi:adenine-specific DNA-methyltransferase
MKLSIIKPRQALNKAYLKEKLGRADIELFKRNFLHMLERINEQESEEHGKNIVSDFFKDTWYKESYEINTKDRKDLVIHTGKTAKEAVGVILEVKKPANKAEMVSVDKPNTKAFHELILYYLRERIDGNNKFIRNLIITNVLEWYIIDEIWFEKYIYGNTALKKEYEEFKLSGKPTHFFYDCIAKPFLDRLEAIVPCTYFNILDYRQAMRNVDKADDNKLISLYKILSPAHLLKEKFANDSNTLDKHFYEELLHIVGLEEIKDGSKKLINRKKHPQEGSLLENTIIKIEDRDLLRNIAGISAYGNTTTQQTYNVALELSITWINRILFLKLLEAQLAKYHKNAKEYLFLNNTFIHDFDELSNLFFGVLAEKQDKRRPHLQNKFKHVPYLNSSLFERTELERQIFDISALDNQLVLPLSTHTVLKDDKGRRVEGALTTLQYLFRFLDAYDFSSEGAEEIQEENKNLINASVLGLIFEKINGYKDGSFFTPGFVTMYMCRETIRRAVYEKFNTAKGWQVDNMNDLHAKISDRTEANLIINKLTICDPAVGSGHFLVSALNEIIAIKSELRILTDSEGKTLRDCEIEVVNDELIVIDEGLLFEYNPHSKESRRIQETLFREKQAIIENCLFGVDINPNSVKICRLRLWIELLKNAYYTSETAYTQLETLPNIDINIKCGNSLVSRFTLDTDLGSALKSIKWNITAYQGFVRDYKNATDKEEKRGLEDLIEKIKKDFRSEIGKNDPKLKKLAKYNSEYFEKYQANKLFDANLSAAQKRDKKKLEETIAKLNTEIDEIKSNAMYGNAFEWRFEFPEVLDDDGHFIGFDIVIGNPPYVQLQKFQEADKNALERQQFETHTKTGDINLLYIVVKMIYAYIRVSTDKQTTENQRFEIENFAKRKEIKVSRWVEETISSRKDLQDRAFGTLLHNLKFQDVLIVSEISRMGRNLMQIMSILNLCMERQVKVYAIKEGYELGDNINSKVLAFAFGLSAEIERTLISQRIKEALARRKAEGIKLGRPKGSRKQFPKLAPHASYIRAQLAKGASQISIARSLNVHRHTVKDWIEQHKELIS